MRGRDDLAAMRIVIVGAGIAGLTAAVALRRFGFNILLLEAAPAVTEIGAGIQLSPNSTCILRELDLLDDVCRHAVRPEKIEIFDGRSGRRINRIPLGAYAEQRYGSPYLVIQRSALHGVLMNRIGTDTGIELILGQQVHSAAIRDDRIVVSAGNSDHSGALLIAADGIRSILRQSLFGQGSETPTGRAAWRTVLPSDCPIGAFVSNSTRMWLGHQSHFVCYPVDPRYGINCVFIGSDGGPERFPPRDTLPAIAADLNTMTEWMHWPLSANDPDVAWATDRAVMIGDAAHAMLPTAAQGGAQAIEDAWILAAVLSHWPEDLNFALRKFQAIRKPRVARIHSMSELNNRIYGLHGALALVRNAVISTIPAPFHLSRMDWLYGWKPELSPTELNTDQALN